MRRPVRTLIVSLAGSSGESRHLIANQALSQTELAAHGRTNAFYMAVRSVSKLHGALGACDSFIGS